jgi:ribosome maturation factor RimP
MNLFEKNIKELISEVVEANNFLLIEIVIRGYRTNRVIEVFIDGENFVSADDCSKISKKIIERFKDNILSEENYRLDISSPGTDRPLKYVKQFPKHINRMFDLSYNLNDETRRITAKLIEVNGNELKFLTANNDEMILNFNNIIKAKVIVSFS